MGMDPSTMQLPFDGAEMRRLLLMYAKRRAELTADTGKRPFFPTDVRVPRAERPGVSKEQWAQDSCLRSLIYIEGKLYQLREFSYGQMLAKSFFDLKLSDLVEGSGKALARSMNYEVSAVSDPVATDTPTPILFITRHRLQKPPHFPISWDILEQEFNQHGFFIAPEYSDDSSETLLMPRRPHFQMLDLYLTMELAMNSLPVLKELDCADVVGCCLAIALG